MRKLTFKKGAYYHIYNRGVDNRFVFSSQEDYDRFEAYLYLLNDTESTRAANFFHDARQAEIFMHNRVEPLVAIGAYCLMQDRFDLLLTPLAENGIPKFMQKLQTGYTMYYNEKYQRSGSLFQGTYKAEHVDTKNRLKYIYSFIHMQPASLFKENWNECDAATVKMFTAHALKYRYSSAGEYQSSRYVITSPKYFPRSFKACTDPATLTAYWLQGKN